LKQSELPLSANGAKCKSLGHRPREMQAVVTALKARNFRVAEKLLLVIHVVTFAASSWLCRAFSAFYLG